MPRAETLSACVLALAAAGCFATIDDSRADAVDAAAGDAGADSGTACKPGMIAIPGEGYCIDAYEVTIADYAAFLREAPQPTPQTQRPECAWNTTFVPDAWNPDGPAKTAVNGVDWCDAAGYCAHYGKRLCGAIGGGAIAFDSAYDPARGEWYRACSRGGAHAYPYGAAYDKAACYGLDSVPKPSAPEGVGQLPTCAGGYDGLFDMSGNVQEWIDACNTVHSIPYCQSPGPECDLCRSAGGGFDNDAQQLRCDTGDQLLRNGHFVHTGIRCCADR